MDTGSKVRRHRRTSEMLFDRKKISVATAAQLQLKLVSTVGDNKKGFLKYVNSKKRTRDL